MSKDSSELRLALTWRHQSGDQSTEVHSSPDTKPIIKTNIDIKEQTS